MRTTTRRASLCAAGPAAALNGCAAVGDVLPDIQRGCTEVGNAEGVSVDLADVLDLEGGDYFAEVSVPAQGASSIRGFAGNDEYYPSGDVAHVPGRRCAVTLIATALLATGCAGAANTGVFSPGEAVT